MVKRIWRVAFGAASLALPVVASAQANQHIAQGPTAVQAAAPKPLQGAIASHPDWPEAKAEDVDSVEHILAALYGVISGPAHQPRDWTRMRSLFVPEARLVPVRVVAATPDGKAKASTDLVFLTIDDYIARASPHMEADGFFEHGVHNDIEQFGNIVDVFSTYESRHATDDAKPFARGINSIQLLKANGRYWIVQIYWDAEREGLTIPSKYLPTAYMGDVDRDRPNMNFAGDWTGQLEYRDYQSDERVFLPTWLAVDTLSDGHALNLAYTYDDGPTKVVREKLTLSLSPQTNSATVTDSDHASASYTVAGFEEFSKHNRGKLILMGRGKENDKPVDVRITLALGRNLLTWRKDTRPAGSTDEFKFRDGYTMTRANAPSL